MMTAAMLSDHIEAISIFLEFPTNEERFHPPPRGEGKGARNAYC